MVGEWGSLARMWAGLGMKRENGADGQEVGGRRAEEKMGVEKQGRARWICCSRAESNNSRISVILK